MRKRFGKLREGGGQLEFERLCRRLNFLLNESGPGARAESAFEERLGFVSDDFLRIDAPLDTQSVAGIARAVGTVERKRSRLQLRDAHAALYARKLARVEPLVTVHDGDDDQSVSQLNREIDGSFEAFLDSLLHREAVDHYFDGVVLAAVERDIVFKRTNRTIDPGANETLPRILFEILLKLAFTAAHDRSEDHNAVIRLEREDVFQNLFSGLTGNLDAAIRAERSSDRRIQQP